MSYKILLIDDSITIHRVIDLSVDTDKYSVNKVFSAEDARSKIKESKPDIILLDNKLEGVKTRDFIRELKGGLPEVKIILLVGAFDKMDESAVEKTGADDFIVKPFNSTSLEEKLEAFSQSKDNMAETGRQIESDKKDEAIEELMASIDEEKQSEYSEPEEEATVTAEQVEESENLDYSTPEDERDDEYLSEEVDVLDEKSELDNKIEDSSLEMEDFDESDTKAESPTVEEYSEETEAGAEMPLSEKEGEQNDDIDYADEEEGESIVDEVKSSEDDFGIDASGVPGEEGIGGDNLDKFFDGLQEVEADAEVELEFEKESISDEDETESDEMDETAGLSEALSDLAEESDDEIEEPYGEEEIPEISNEISFEDVAKDFESEDLGENEVPGEEKTENIYMDKGTIVDALREVLGEYKVEIDENIVQSAVEKVLDGDFLKEAVRQALYKNLEKAIWEVVPDLSEKLILEEIEKLKENSGEDE